MKDRKAIESTKDTNVVEKVEHIDNSLQEIVGLGAQLIQAINSSNIEKNQMELEKHTQSIELENKRSFRAMVVVIAGILFATLICIAAFWTGNAEQAENILFAMGGLLGGAGGVKALNANK